MSKRPIYMRNKNRTGLLFLVLLLFLGGIVYNYNRTFSYDYFVENSELKGRTFKGNVAEVIDKKTNLKAYFIAEKDAPLVALSFIFAKSGFAYEDSSLQGISNLVAATLDAGAGKRNAEALKKDMDINGIKISFNTDKDAFNGIITFPKGSLSKAVDILRSVLMTPKFENKYVETAKAQILKSLEAEKENPANQLKLAVNEFVYDNHNYSRNMLGTIDTVNKIKGSDLKNFVKTNLVKNGLYIGVAGDLTDDEVKKTINGIFGDLPQHSNSKNLEDAVIDWDKNNLQIDRVTGQNIATYIMTGTCRKCEDFYPLYIANYLFGGAGLNSRLNQQIREKEGLTYGAYSSMILSDKSNLIMAGFSATKDNFAKAEKMFFEEFNKVAQKGFLSEELKNAKDYLTASYNLRFASTIGIAEMLAYMQKYDLGKDFLQKRNEYVMNVTLEQLNAVAEKYFGSRVLKASIGSF